MTVEIVEIATSGLPAWRLLKRSDFNGNTPDLSRLVFSHTWTVSAWRGRLLTG